jgi:hypothetical protein
MIELSTASPGNTDASDFLKSPAREEMMFASGRGYWGIWYLYWGE